MFVDFISKKVHIMFYNGLAKFTWAISKSNLINAPNKQAE